MTACSTALTLIVLAVALAAGLGLLAARFVFGPAAPAAPQTQAVRLFSPARELPSFSLRQSDGTAFVPGELKGHWTLVFLGFASCPDVCPMTLSQMSQAQKRWEDLPEAVRPRVLFVSVDPERDTPERIGEYAHAFHKDTLAVTADVPALERFARSLSLVFAKVPVEGAPATQYTMDHSSAMAVIDPRGRMAGIVRPPFDPAAIASDLRRLTEDAR